MAHLPLVNHEPVVDIATRNARGDEVPDVQGELSLVEIGGPVCRVRATGGPNHLPGIFLDVWRDNEAVRAAAAAPFRKERRSSSFIFFLTTSWVGATFSLVSIFILFFIVNNISLAWV